MTETWLVAPRRSGRHRRWLRYSLRGLLAFVFVAALPAWWVRVKLDRFAYEREAILSLVADGAQIRTVSASPEWFWRLLSGEIARRYEHAVAVDLHNGGMGNVSDRHLALVGRLPELQSLTVLNLDGNEDRLFPRGALTRLRYLNVSGCRALTDAALCKFAGAKHLRTLHVGGTNISDASAPVLAGFKELESLSLQGTRLGDGSMSDLRRLSRLAYLGLPATVTLPGLRHLAGMDELAQLDAWILPGDEAEAIELLAALTSLRHLTLRGRGGSKLDVRAFRAVSSMPKLESLEIRNARIAAADLQELKLAPSLRSVQLSGTGLDEHVGDWRKRFAIPFVSARDEHVIDQWINDKPGDTVPPFPGGD